MSTAVQRPIDDATFTDFLQRAMPAVRRLVDRLCGNEADAEDVVQETLAKVWRLRASFDAARNGDAWLLQAAFRCFCDLRKRARTSPATTDAAATPAPAAPCLLELRDEVRHRLQALDPLPRALLLGFHGEGCSLHELAARHGLPVNTVKSHLHRARLRLALEKPPEEP
jgi:RNA polymerase sigma-70 factor (ECF subfamily)